MIQLKNISKTYFLGKIAVHALQEVSLSINQGEFVAIMGPSGSGKSTLLHILGFLDKPDKGEYIILNKSVKKFSDNELSILRNELVGFVFQQFHLLPRMKAEDNVSLPNIYGSKNNNSHEAALEKLESVGLKDRALHRPNELSGGEQQRVAIARALVKNPMVIFTDEPTGNLDTKSGKEIMNILKSLNEKGKTIIMVTHDKEISKYASRLITMQDGKIISDEKKSKESASPQKDQNINEVLFKKRSVFKKGELINHIKQAMSAILSNKVRSFLSMLGILVGVAAVIAMMALGEGAKSAMEERLKSLGSNLLSIRGGSAKVHGAARGAASVTRFTFGDVEAIESLDPFVSKAAGTVRGSAQVIYQNQNWNTRIEGVGYSYGEMRASIPEVGRWFTEYDIVRREKVAIIGVTVAKELFGDKYPIGKTVKINRINFRVVGIAPEKGSGGWHDRDDVVYIPATTAMYRVLGKDYLDGIYVEVADAALIDEAQEKIERIIRKRHRLLQGEDSFYIRDMSEIQEMLTSTTQTMSLLLGCIALIALLVGGIGIMNILLVSVTERTREIGLRKAIGARKSDILVQFLIESIVMTFIGGVLGIAFGALTAFSLAFFAGWATSISIFSVLLAVIFSVIVGICFGMWPAKKASQLNPVEALRYE